MEITDNTDNTDKNNEEIDNKLLEFYKNAEHISIIPLLKLIYLTTEIDLSDKFQLQYSIKSKERFVQQRRSVITNGRKRKT